MKVFAVLTLCIFVGEFKVAFTEDAMEMYQRITAECVSETGASQGNVEVMMKNLPALDRTTKCLRACVMKKLNVLNDNGKFVKSVALKIMELHTQGDPEKMQVMDEATNICQDIAIPDDHCEAAELYKMCMLNEFRKRGLEMI